MNVQLAHQYPRRRRAGADVGEGDIEDVLSMAAKLYMG